MEILLTVLNNGEWIYIIFIGWYYVNKIISMNKQTHINGDEEEGK